MNPDKLFNYLEGNLPAFEREQIEEQLLRDPALQRELAMARKIHSRMQGESREVLLENEDANSARGRKMALRVGTAFIILMGLNVAFGLFMIMRHESANPNHKLLEQQMRDQIAKSLDQVTRTELTPAPLDLDEITIPVSPGKRDAIANGVVATAKRLGGSATKELPEKHQVGVLVDLPANRETEFRNAVAAMSSAAPVSPSPVSTPTDGSAKSFIVHIVEPTPRD